MALFSESHSKSLLAIAHRDVISERHALSVFRSDFRGKADSK